MIKLKNMLTELNLNQGHAGWGPHGPANSFMEYHGRYANIRNQMKTLVKGKTYSELMNIVDVPMPDELKNALKSSKISGTDELMVIRLKDGEYSSHHYYLLDFSNELIKDIIVGTIHTEPMKVDTVNLKGEGVHWSEVSKSVRGNGYGKILYDAVLDSAGVLFSDDILYEGSLGMWIYHMQKKPFFGGIINVQSMASEDAKYIVPLDSKMVGKKDFLSERVEHFIVTNNRYLLPKTVRLLEHNVSGIDMTREFAIIRCWSKFKINSKYMLDIAGVTGKKTKGIPVLTYRYDVDDKLMKNLQKLPSGFTIEDYLELFGGLDSLLYLVNNSSVANLDMEMALNGNAKRIKLAVLQLDDVILLLKDKADGISVQVLQ